MPDADAHFETRPLRIARTLAAARDEVFRAWTEPAALVDWFAPSDDYTVVVSKLELRVGGAYRIEMHHKDGPVHRVMGSYREIDSPRRLAFTWRWEDTEMEDTLVTLDLREEGTATELVLTHGGLVARDAQDKHRHGWRGCLDRLERLLGVTAGSTPLGMGRG